MISITSIVILLSVFMVGLFLGVPIAFALGLSGIITILTTVGPQFMTQVPMALHKPLAEFVFVAIPLYVLMGEILYQGKSGERIFWLADSWFRRIRGGTGAAAVAAYTFFAAIVGSSMTSVLTIGKIAIPEMRKQKYAKGLTYGLSAVGGSLGILIPPSLALILYASLTGTSPSKLFIAGIVPGLIISFLLLCWTVLKAPKSLPLNEAISSSYEWSSKDRIIETLRAVPDILLPIVVLGGIYTGIYTPTEAAAVGVIYAIVVSMGLYRSLKIKQIPGVLIEAVKSTAMLLSIVVGALVFGSALTLIGLPQFLSNSISSLEVAPWVVLLVMNLIWLIMGFFLEVVSILLITTPIFFPVAVSLGFDPIWFGIIMVLNMELAVMTPPLGMNLFAIKSLLPEESIENIIKGALPFVVFVILVLALVLLFPQIALGLL